MDDRFYRQLPPEEAAEFRLWAREHYTAGEEINSLWHPVVRDECQKMNDAAAERQWLRRAEEGGLV